MRAEGNLWLALHNHDQRAALAAWRAQKAKP
jgi:hypothetical protein